MSIQIGDRVEVIGFEPRFEHSYFEGNVVGRYNDMLVIQYVDLLVTKNGPQLLEMIGAEHVRPYPPHIEYILAMISGRSSLFRIFFESM